jgi:hypothetical protein
MKPFGRLLGLVVAVGAAGVVASSAIGQVRELRDERTGKVWTPEFIEVNPDGSAKSDVDKAFDPRSQTARVQGVVVQRPRANLMGTVPITAGPTVPIVVLDTPSLQAVPGGSWLAILYVTNNSANTVDAVVGCHFTNQGKKVEDVRVIVPPAGPGERLGVPVRGPRTDIFVDQVRCELTAPI